MCAGSDSLRAKVIGIGSPFGADRAGWEVIERLAAAPLPGVTLEALDRPGALVLERMVGWPWVVLVDALAGGEAGRVRHLTAEAVEQLEEGLSSHGFGLQQSLALGRALGWLPPRLDIVAIEVGEGLGQDGAWREGVARAAERVRRLVR